ILIEDGRERVRVTTPQTRDRVGRLARCLAFVGSHIPYPRAASKTGSKNPISVRMMAAARWTSHDGLAPSSGQATESGRTSHWCCDRGPASQLLDSGCSQRVAKLAAAVEAG